jgi:hypothetical protein
MRARGKGTGESPANTAQDPSPEVVEVYAARAFQESFKSVLFVLSCLTWKWQRYVAHKPKHEKSYRL